MLLILLLYSLEEFVFYISETQPTLFPQKLDRYLDFLLIDQHFLIFLIQKYVSSFSEASDY